MNFTYIGIQMESESCKIRLLDANNWHNWRIDIKVLRMDHACWGFIDGSEPKFELERATRKEIVEYSTRKDRAFTTIYYSIEEQYCNLLSDTMDGKVAFGILESYFQPSTRARVISQLDEFFSMRFENSKETIGLFCA